MQVFYYLKINHSGAAHSERMTGLTSQEMNVHTKSGSSKKNRIRLCSRQRQTPSMPKVLQALWLAEITAITMTDKTQTKEMTYTSIPLTLGKSKNPQ